MHIWAQSIREPLLIKAFILACLLFPQAHGADWRSSGGPDGKNITSVLAVDAILLAGANPGGIFRSADHGMTWAYVGAGTRAQSITGLSKLGDLVIAASNSGGLQSNGLAFSSDRGLTWSDNPQPWPFLGIEAFTVHGNSLFIKVAQGGLFRSDDTAKTWQNLEAAVPGGIFLNIKGFAASGDTLLAATDGGVMATSDQGESWSDLTANLPDSAYSSQALSGNPVYSVFATDQNLFAGTRSAVYRRKKTDPNWEEILRLEDDVKVNTLFAMGDSVFAGTDGLGVFRSLDNGQTWSPFNDGLAVPFIHALSSQNGKLYAGTQGGGVFETLQGPEAGAVKKVNGPSSPHIRLAWSDGTLRLLPDEKISGQVELEIFDLSGRSVLVFRGPVARGSALPFVAPRGMYFARIRFAGFTVRIAVAA